MTLPASGTLSASDINTELYKTATATLSLNDTDARTLAGIPTSGSQIAFSDFYGKANRLRTTVSLTANTSDYTLNPSKISGYVAGKTDVSLVVDSGVYLYATTTTTAALTVTGWSAGDTVKIVNNGYIIGRGGNGGGGSNPGANGGPAISLGFSITLDGSSYIAGGGGGGAGPFGGGGAGGGNGNNDPSYSYASYPGLGGAPGQPGANSTGTYPYESGCGGGRIVPGTGGSGALLQAFSGATNPTGGGAGGGGGGYSGKIPGTPTWENMAGGGGGGWGASGGRGVRLLALSAGAQGGAGGSGGNVGGGGGGASGSGTQTIYNGGIGGYAVALNGYSVTTIGSPTFYGTVG